MLRPKTGILYVMALFTASALAGSVNRGFHEQDSTTATLIPMSRESLEYFGLDAGVERVTLKSTVNQYSTNRKPFGYNFSLFGGYGRNFRHLYLGTELGAGYTTLDRDINIFAAPLYAVKLFINIRECVRHFENRNTIHYRHVFIK